MAKKKKDELEEINESENQINTLLAEIEKNYGSGVMRSGDQLIDNPPEIISFSPSIDYILGGGVCSGNWLIMEGAAKTGKSTSLLSFCANAQKVGRHIMVLSAEHRMDAMTLKGIKGLSTEMSKFSFIESVKGRQLSSEDFLNIGLTFLKTVPRGVLLIDSVSCLTSPRVIEKGINSSDMGAGNQILGKFVDIASPIIRAQGSILLGIAQQYANISGWGKKTNTKISNRWKYQADIILEITDSNFEYANEANKEIPPVGQSQTIVCRKSALCGPMRKTTSYLRYNLGIDKLRELMVQANNYGLISTKGAGWTSLNFLTPDLIKDTEFEDKEEIKIQGIEKTYQLLETNPKWIEYLEQSIKDILNPPAEK